MRLHDIPPALLCLVAAILSTPVTAGLIPNPFTHEGLPSLEDQQDVQKRCANPCGYYGQLCCDSDQYCYTDSNDEAACGLNQATSTDNVDWVYYTTTYVETDLQTITATYSSYCPKTTEVTTTISCLYSQGETSCVSRCCLSGQYCASSGVCKDTGGGGGSGAYSSLITVTVAVTQSATAPARVTSNSITTYTITQSGSVTATSTFEPPVGTAGIIQGTQSTTAGHGLSAGAIAGIVIGVIIAIIILLLCCACFCAKELFDGILDIFGLGNRKTTREETIIEERRSSRHNGRTNNRTWFGTRPSRPKRSDSDRGGVGFLGVAGLLAGLAVVLGLKRRHDRKEEKSSVSGYSYYDSQYTSRSSESSDRQTRRSSRGGGSRSRSRVSRR